MESTISSGPTFSRAHTHHVRLTRRAEGDDLPLLPCSHERRRFLCALPIGKSVHVGRVRGVVASADEHPSSSRSRETGWLALRSENTCPDCFRGSNRTTRALRCAHRPTRYFGPQRTVRSRTLPAGSASSKPSLNQRVQPRGRRVSRRTPKTFRRFLALMVASEGRRGDMIWSIPSLPI
jgi:hypothetical protein